MMKMGKNITYLKLNASSVKDPADPVMEAGCEGIVVNLLTRWEMKLNDIPGMQPLARGDQITLQHPINDNYSGFWSL
jgi:hypothetical protein